MPTKVMNKPTLAQSQVIEDMLKGYKLSSLLSNDAFWPTPHAYGGTLRDENSLRQRMVPITTITAMLKYGLIVESSRYVRSERSDGVTKTWHIDYQLMEKSAGDIKPVEMCPFCPLMVEEALREPIGNDFFGAPAKIDDVPSCDSCAQVAAMSEDGGQSLLDKLKA